ncbi:MAG TPA: redoxin family protein [Gemmataceae bacterium]|nr:redoxin family protein [Gemmataceae bacterium]
MTVGQRLWLVLALFAGAVGFLMARPDAGDRPVKVGDRIANLTFKDIRYLPRSLDDFTDRKVFVLVFTTTGCPLVERYLPTLSRLEKEYRDRGVQFLAINVGADDSIVAMASQAVEHEMEFPFVKDFDHRCVRALGVKRTPEVVVLDAERQLRYRGRIDDQYRLGGARSAPTRHDLREALEAVLAGREVAIKETPVDGCLITAPVPPAPPTLVTFTEHIAPLLQKHCQDCHRPEASAPFSLVTYRQVTARADMIAEVVAEQRMPPWYASPHFGTFANRRGLTPAERDLFLYWLRSGMPYGDESKMPKPRPDVAKPSKWLIGEPDLVLQAPEHELPAQGDVAYKYVVLPHVFLHETWVQGVQILPDNPKVLHHCNMAYGTLGGGVKKRNFITGYVPGNGPMILDEGLGFRIPAGSVLGLEIHYVTTGKPERCRIAVGLRYARGTVQKQLRHVLLEDLKFVIPPGAPAHRVAVSKTLEHDVEALGLFCHMHLRGRDMTFKAHRPDGTSETLLMVPNYSFDWQMPYVFERGKILPKGTRLECIAHYDNSAFNAYNPDPTREVRFGLQTRDEMFNGFFFYTIADEQLNLAIDPKTGRPMK